MKTLYLMITLIFLIAQNSFGQFYRQYFDGADTVYNMNMSPSSILVTIDDDSTNIWQIGKPQKVIFDSAATQPNAIVTDTLNYYPVNNMSSFGFKIRPWTNWGILALQWKQKLDMDSDFDGGIIEYSIDHGNSWINVFDNPYTYNYYGFQPQNKDTLQTGEVAFSGTDSTWRDIWLCFGMSWLQQAQDTIYFKFTFKSDSIDNNKEGWMIDNLLAHITMIHTVKETEKDNRLNVYPNPANNIVNIETEKVMEFHIIELMELIDPLGRVVERWKNIPTKFWFKTDKYNDGLYYLKVKTNLKSETVPLVISKH